MPLCFSLRAVRPHVAGAAATLFASLLTLAAGGPAAAASFDFSDELQSFRNGEAVETVRVHGATMRIAVEHHSSHEAIVFDSEHPKHHPELGTPNEDFDGPGKGDGGERDEDGENKHDLGKVLVIAEDDDDLTAGDGTTLSSPDLEDGVIRLSFSHAGYLTFKLINVDDGDTHIVAYRDREVVGELDACEFGENSVQKVDLSRFGTVDCVAIDMDGVSAVAAIRLEVPVTAIESSTWTGVKNSYR